MRSFDLKAKNWFINCLFMQNRFGRKGLPFIVISRITAKHEKV